jgi:hypothetical protein
MILTPSPAIVFADGRVIEYLEYPKRRTDPQKILIFDSCGVIIRVPNISERRFTMAEPKPVIVPHPNNQTNNNDTPPQKRPKPTKALPTERIRMDKQLQILRAFAALSGATGKAVQIEDVAEATGMKASTVAITPPFFVSIQLLQRSETGFTPSSEVISLQRAHDWNPETAPHKLAPAIRRTWFAEELLPKVAFGPIAETVAIQKLAEASAASPEHEPQLQVLIEYLQVAGLLTRDGGMLRKGTIEISDVAPAIPPNPSPETEVLEEKKEIPRTNVKTAFSQNPAGRVEFNISVQVDMAEFSTWQPDRISAFFGGLAAVLSAKADVEKKS